IRTFPMLALAGGVLYLLDPAHFIPFTAGLVILGAWLVIYYRAYVGVPDEHGEPNAGIVVLILNVHAYLLGAVALALPPWIAVTMTVVSVLLLTGREQLHALARRLDIGEIITAGQFLILTGIVLPLLPNQPVTTLTPITPRHAWLALIVVCTFSYVSYLVQRYWAAAIGGMWMEKEPVEIMRLAASGNPLALGAAAIFALLFVVNSVILTVVKSQFGVSGIYALAAIVGIADVDPFVLGLAQGGVAGVENTGL